MENTIQQVTEQAAKQDMAIARKRGVVAICQTKIGNVELTYDRATKTYSMTNFNNGTELHMNLKAGEMVKALSAVYVVTF